MSQENVELHRRAVAAFNTGDMDAFIALSDRMIEIHSTFAVVGGTEYRGHEGVRRWHRDLADAWGDELRAEPQMYFDLGEHTLAFNVLHGRGRRSGVEVGVPAALVARWRDGLCVYWKGYASRADALAELGLSEDALEPIDP